MAANRALNVIYVTGWRSPKKRFLRKTDPAADYKSIAEVFNNGKAKYTDGLILNRVWFPCNTSKRAVNELISKLYQVSKPEDLRGEIINVVVGHSNGAKVIHKALKKDTLKYFLQNCNDKDARIKSIREHTAVITLGGIQDIPKNFAKKVLALRLKDDIISVKGAKLYSENVEDAAEVVEIRCEDSRPFCFLQSFNDKALQKKAIECFPQSRGGKEARIDSILRHTAVITLREIQDIPKGFAKNVLALRLKGDVLSIKIYNENVEDASKIMDVEIFYKERQQCYCPEKKDTPPCTEDKPNPRLLLLSELATASWIKLIAKHRPSGDALVPESRHDAEEYRACEKAADRMKKLVHQ